MGSAETHAVISAPVGPLGMRTILWRDAYFGAPVTGSISSPPSHSRVGVASQRFLNEFPRVINRDGILTLDDEYHFSAMERTDRTAKVKVLHHVVLQKLLPGAVRRIG